MFAAAIRLAIVLSAIAGVLAVGLERAGGVSPTVLVAAVAVVGFVTSWVLTGRVTRSASFPSAHRIAVIPLRHRVS